MQDDKLECSIIKWKKILDDETKPNSLLLAFGEGNSAFIKDPCFGSVTKPIKG